MHHFNDFCFLKFNQIKFKVNNIIHKLRANYKDPSFSETISSQATVRGKIKINKE